MTSGDTGMDRFPEALRLLRTESDTFCGELASLAVVDWDRPTNCEPWSVRVLVAHVVRGAESYLMGLERGLEGILEPALAREQRTQRMNEIAAQQPAPILADLRAITNRFEEQFGRLQPCQLNTLAYHPYGPRPARWFVEQRLAEVAFHRWDLLQSVGRLAALDDATAAFLLPMLLEQNLPVMMGPEGPRGEGTFKLAVRGQAEAAWRIVAAPGSVQVTSDRDAVCDASIDGQAADLALLVYGRSKLADLERAGGVSVTGDRILAQRFHDLFRGP